ncbi:MULTISPECIES: class I SAM-dependent DNA methyltransferase [Flavobacterium]|uniref:Class I SAM-dependent DNA methyltransferase n=1 Tax=Flavobacterium jumunjinense TaxID=998845 RepID=A0ABV5GU89_9FLAO|nr:MULTISPECIES: class I SAM-dependent methyltransferase [Flavobacterium]
MNNEIKNYYDELATTYDENRFGNSYGKFIDEQERTFLLAHLPKSNDFSILDLGCGTGRLLEFANFGVDVSEKMIEIAKNKFSDKEFKIGSISSIPYDDDFFDTIFSFHVIMHLDKTSTLDFLKESRLKLKTKGNLIFDFPSKKRRLLTNYKADNWHGANHFSIDEIKEVIGEESVINTIRGVLFLPIHRIPIRFRKFVLKLDDLLCNSFLKEYASYLIIELKKK